jgi:hypothetical protein
VVVVVVLHKTLLAITVAQEAVAAEEIVQLQEALEYQAKDLLVATVT